MFSFFKKKEAEKEIPTQLEAYLTGKLVGIEQVPDAVFSARMLGDGVAIIPENETVTAPVAGTVAAVMEDSRHACGIKTDNGLEVLIHVGLDTVSMNGDGFQLHVKMGDRVKAGDKLITFSKEKIKNAGHPDITMLVITNGGETEQITFVKEQEVQAGDVIAEIR